MLEARLDQEKDILLTACWRLQSLDEVIDTGGLRFLGYKRSSLEAGVNILQKVRNGGKLSIDFRSIRARSEHIYISNQ